MHQPRGDAAHERPVTRDDRAKVKDGVVVLPPMEADYTLDVPGQFDKNASTVRRKPLCPCLPPRPPAAPKQPQVPITRVLGLLTGRYKVYMVLGAIFSAAQGVVFPVFSIVFGQLFNIFYSNAPSDIREKAGYIAAGFVGIAVYNLITGYLGQMFWGLVGEEVGVYFRREFFLALLRQEVGYCKLHRRPRECAE